MNNVVKKFKKGNRILLNKSSGIRKMLTAAGGPLQLTPEEQRYLEWSKMSPELKREYRTNKAKSHLLSGPNITNFWEAFQTYIGNRDPKNPNLQTGDVPNPGMRNPKLIAQTVQKAKSIALRAAKISDRVFDRQYLRAISSGNSKRVLAVRDLHFKGKTGNDLILTTYRSLFSNSKNESFGFNPYSDVRKARNHYGYFTTPSKAVASTYKYEENSPLFSIYTHMKNPYIVDANGRSWLAVEIFSPPGSTAKYGRTTDLVVKRVLSEGNNDGVIIKNIMDVGAKRANLNGASEITDDYITFPGRAKLKDAITYDNNGNIIPISLRDDFSIFDIRYKQGGQIRKMQTAAGGPLYLSVEDIKNGANALGSAFLKGLGTVGRFLNAGFTSPTYGTIGQVSYARNAKDAKRLRKLSESLEQALSKGATYIMPANYIVGKGNPVKGEETISLMLPWQLALIRGSELYFGPKAVKGVKATPKAVVNTAAKAGSKTAKKAVVAREINNATKKGILSLEKLQPEIRTRYGDVEIDNPELAYRLVGKGAVENFLKTGELFVPVKLTGNKLRDALNNMMGGTPMYKQGSLWYGLDPINYPELFTTAEPLAIGNKHATIVKPWIDPGRVIKKGIRTGEVDYVGRANLLGGRRVPFTENLLNLSNVTSYKWVPGYGYRKVIQEPRTSLKFYERKPSRITETEKAGVPKGERNQPLKRNPQAGVQSQVDTWLINRTNTPLNFINGRSVWMPGRGRAGAERPTVHFTTDLPVTAHMGGNWDRASETILTPYKLVVTDNGNPMNIEPMDTYFSNLYPFIIRLEGTKIFTGNPLNYRHYKAQGVDAYTSKRAQKVNSIILRLQQQYDVHEAHARLRFIDLGGKFTDKGYWNWDNLSPEATLEVRALIDDRSITNLLQKAGIVNDKIHRQWVAQLGARPTMLTYQQMEKETGLRSYVEEFPDVTTYDGPWSTHMSYIDYLRQLYKNPELHRQVKYHSTPATHSNSWFMDWLTPKQRIQTLARYIKEYPQVITALDFLLAERILRLNPELTSLDLQLGTTPKEVLLKALIDAAKNKRKPLMLKKLGGILQFLQKHQQGGYIVQPNDNLWNISRNHGISLSELRNLNPQIKGDLIHPGDRLLITPQYKNKIVNLREERSRELNLDSIKAIQTYNHSGNYIIVDKKNSLLTVFDKNNNPIFKTNDISTGKSGDDYNTITYVDSKGKIRNNAGNNSTPAGITYITGKGKYHGFTSFTRGRINPDGSIEDIASSFHYGPTKDKKASNGCVRIGGKTLDKLSKYIDLGTPVYTLPEKEGSGFKLRNGKLNFVADNPYGTTKGSKKYWDDYNVRIDRSYSPLTIYYNGTNNDSTYNGNVLRFVNSISANKKALQKKFNLSSDEYNRLAELAVGIAELESKYGTSKRYKAKSYMPDWMISSIRGKNAARSRGMSQIKIKGDNKEMQNIYKQLKVNENSINNPETSAVATMARLAYMYNSEVKGRSFRGAKNSSVDPYDALLYKYMGRGLELSNKTATPLLNNYINNVKNYSKNFEFLEERRVRV